MHSSQLRRWLQFFQPAQMLLVSFAGYTRKPAAVVRDVLTHAGVPPAAASRAAAATRVVKNRNSKVLGHGKMPQRLRAELHALYDPFVQRLYELIDRHRIAVTPCEHRGTRFLDDPDAANATAAVPKERADAADV